MGIKKNLKKLMSEPKKMRLEGVISVLHFFGYKLTNIKGSHYCFQHPYLKNIIIPAHQKQVKGWYLKKVKGIIRNEFHDFTNL